jgi:ADP-dependent NAD(P)H-hydrate dehydratase
MGRVKMQLKKNIVKFNFFKAGKLIPTRKQSDNKSNGGKSLIIAGSEGKFGAAVLAATACARMGSGYVFLMTDQNKFSSHKNPDFLIFDINKKISDIDFTSAGIGPGLSKSAQSFKLLKQLILSKKKLVVIDAEALNLLASNKKLKIPKSWVATPHEAELSRLINSSVPAIKKNRIKYVQKAQQKLGCVVLLKGHKTLVADENQIFEIQAGNAALAKAGTGDVLTGMIVGLLAQGLAPTDAACLAAYLHGRIADEWIKDRNDPLSLLASDMLNKISQQLAKIRSRSAQIKQLKIFFKEDV